MEASHENILGFIATIRNSFVGSEEVYTMGSCYRFFKILKYVFPDAVAYSNDMHVVTGINGRFYDITGEVENTGIPVGSCHINRGIEDWVYEIKKPT